MISNMVTRVTKITEIIVGICALSFMGVIILALVLMILAQSETVRLVNAVLQLGQSLGKQ